MVVVGGADYESSPQIDDGLDVTVTGYILDSRYGSPITTGLGTLSSTVSTNEQAAVAGPTPVATSGGAFTVTIPIATLAGGSLIFVTVVSSVANARSFTIFLRPWLQAEIDAIEAVRFVVDQDASVSLGLVQDAYTGLWHRVEDMQEVDGKQVAKRMGMRPKVVDEVTR